jgi:hypothetical protein
MPGLLHARWSCLRARWSTKGRQARMARWSTKGRQARAETYFLPWLATASMAAAAASASR